MEDGLTKEEQQELLEVENKVKEISNQIENIRKQGKDAYGQEITMRAKDGIMVRVEDKRGYEKLLDDSVLVNESYSKLQNIYKKKIKDKIFELKENIDEMSLSEPNGKDSVYNVDGVWVKLENLNKYHVALKSLSELEKLDKKLSPKVEQPKGPIYSSTVRENYGSLQEDKMSLEDYKKEIELARKKVSTSLKVVEDIRNQGKEAIGNSVTVPVSDNYYIKIEDGSSYKKGLLEIDKSKQELDNLIQMVNKQVYDVNNELRKIRNHGLDVRGSSITQRAPDGYTIAIEDGFKYQNLLRRYNDFKQLSEEIYQEENTQETQSQSIVSSSKDTNSLTGEVIDSSTQPLTTDGKDNQYLNENNQQSNKENTQETQSQSIVSSSEDTNSLTGEVIDSSTQPLTTDGKDNQDLNENNQQSNEEEIIETEKAPSWFSKHKKAILITTGIAALATVSLTAVIPAIMSANSILWFVANPATQSLLHSINVSLGSIINASFTGGTGIWTAASGSLINAGAAQASIATAIAKLSASAVGVTAIATLTAKANKIFNKIRDNHHSESKEEQIVEERAEKKVTLIDKLRNMINRKSKYNEEQVEENSNDLSSPLNQSTEESSISSEEVNNEGKKLSSIAVVNLLSSDKTPQYIRDYILKSKEETSSGVEFNVTLEELRELQNQHKDQNENQTEKSIDLSNVSLQHSEDSKTIIMPIKYIEKMFVNTDIDSKDYDAYVSYITKKMENTPSGEKCDITDEEIREVITKEREKRAVTKKNNSSQTAVSEEVTESNDNEQKNEKVEETPQNTDNLSKYETSKSKDEEFERIKAMLSGTNFNNISLGTLDDIIKEVNGYENNSDTSKKGKGK